MAPLSIPVLPLTESTMAVSEFATRHPESEQRLRASRGLSHLSLDG
jgi:hypothetical protein